MFIDRIYHKTERIIKNELFWLTLILILAGILNFYPHFNYSFLLHVDEWFHISQAKQIVFSSKIDWYSGEQFSLGMERAWHILLASIYFIFKPSIVQWIYLPTILHLLSILSVYYFVSRLYSRKEGLIASLLIALLPSNVTMGGPVLLLPINLGLIFIPLALLFAFNLTKLKIMYNYGILLLLLVFLLYAHPPTALVLLLILGIYLLLNAFSHQTENKKTAKFLFIVTILSLMISLPNFVSEFQTRGIESITFKFWVYLQGIPLIYGVLQTIFFVIGFYFSLKTEKKETWSLLISSILLIFNVLYFSSSGQSFLLPYQRTHVPLFLLMSIIASHGYVIPLKIKKLHINFRKILFALCLIITIGLSINRNINIPYYKLIDNEDFESFLWIRDNTPSNATIIVDPWKARAFAPIAERRVYAVVPFGPVAEKLAIVNKANQFFARNCSNSSFLVEHNISYIYTTGICNNSDLYQVRKNIYMIKEQSISGYH